MLAELTDKGGSYNGNHFVPFQNGLDHLENLTLIYDRTERAAHKALTAGHTLVLIDGCAAMFVGSNGIHTAGCSAGALQMDDCIIGAGLCAFSTADALIQIDIGTVIAEGDSILGADLLAGSRNAILAIVAHLILVGGASVTGIGNDVDQGRFIILLRNSSRIHALGHQAAGLDRTNGQTHCQSHTLTGNGTLQKHRLPVQGPVTGNNDIGQVLSLGIVTALIGHSGNFSKYFFTNIRNQGRDSSHSFFLRNCYICNHIDSL